MTEKKVRDLVKSILKSELLDVPNKSKIEKIAKDEADKATKDAVSEKDVKDMIKKTMLAYHKWMWEKKGMWINQI